MALLNLSSSTLSAIGSPPLVMSTACCGLPSSLSISTDNMRGLGSRPNWIMEMNTSASLIGIFSGNSFSNLPTFDFAPTYSIASSRVISVMRLMVAFQPIGSRFGAPSLFMFSGWSPNPPRPVKFAILFYSYLNLLFLVITSPTPRIRRRIAPRRHTSSPVAKYQP